MGEDRSAIMNRILDAVKWFVELDPRRGRDSRMALIRLLVLLGGLVLCIVTWLLIGQ